MCSHCGTTKWNDLLEALGAASIIANQIPQENPTPGTGWVSGTEEERKNHALSTYPCPRKSVRDPPENGNAITQVPMHSTFSYGLVWHAPRVMRDKFLLIKIYVTIINETLTYVNGNQYRDNYLNNYTYLNYILSFLRLGKPIVGKPLWDWPETVKKRVNTQKKERMEEETKTIACTSEQPEYKNESKSPFHQSPPIHSKDGCFHVWYQLG